MESQNPWWYGEMDRGYEEWKRKEVKWIPPILQKFNFEPFSLNFLVGPRQVGKTTALKIYIHEVLLRNLSPKSIFYLSCEEVLDFRELGEIIDDYLRFRDSSGVRSSFIILDEITFVRDWHRAVKLRIDSGVLSNDVLIISGSASVDLLRQKESFPGRRGKGVDLYFHPLSFSDYIAALKNLHLIKGDVERIEENMKANKIHADILRDNFRSYMMTGGFPLPITEYFSTGRISYDTRKAYIDWLRNDFLKLGRNESYMKEVLSYIVRSRLSPVSWLGIARETSINSPHTAQQYVEDLEKLFVVKVLNMISPDSRVMYRKSKKIHITDPFLYTTICEYVRAKPFPEDMLESTVASHLSRRYETFYWRNREEVDVVILKDGRQLGIEVKTSPGSWRKPRHLSVMVLSEDSIPLFLASIDI